MVEMWPRSDQQPDALRLIISEQPRNFRPNVGFTFSWLQSCSRPPGKFEICA